MFLIDIKKLLYYSWKLLLPFLSVILTATVVSTSFFIIDSAKNFLTEKKQYTKTEDDFVNQFFEDVKKKEPAQPIQQPKEAVTTPTIQPSKETAKKSGGAGTQGHRAAG